MYQDLNPHGEHLQIQASLFPPQSQPPAIQGDRKYDGWKCQVHS